MNNKNGGSHFTKTINHYMKERRQVSKNLTVSQQRVPDLRLLILSKKSGMFQCTSNTRYLVRPQSEPPLIWTIMEYCHILGKLVLRKALGKTLQSKDQRQFFHLEYDHSVDSVHCTAATAAPLEEDEPIFMGLVVDDLLILTIPQNFLSAI